MFDFIKRFKEPSTWRGVIMLGTAFGVTISPETVEVIIATGTGLVGLVGVLTGDSTEEEERF